MLFNAQSINTNVNEVMDYVSDNNISILALCESWLRDKNSLITATIKARGFNIEHSFRSIKKGGDTALIFKFGYSFHEVKLNENFESFEYTLASLKVENKNKILFLVMYRTGNLTSQFNKDLDRILSEVCALSDCVIMAGDLNIHFNKSCDNALISQTANIIDTYALQWHVSEPTHIKGGSLDKVFSFLLDRKLKFSSCYVDNDILSSDHHSVICTFTVDLKPKYFKSIEFRNVKNIDISAFRNDLKGLVNIHTSSAEHDFEISVNNLMTDTRHLTDQHAPLVKKRYLFLIQHHGLTLNTNNSEKKEEKLREHGENQRL